MVKTKGKVFEAVRELLQQMGVPTDTLRIVSFGRGTYHDIVLHDQVVGSYEHRSQTVTWSEDPRQ